MGVLEHSNLIITELTVNGVRLNSDDRVMIRRRVSDAMSDAVRTANQNPEYDD